MTSATAGGRVGVARVAGVIGILAYVASWLANQEIPDFRDPLWLRAVGVAIIAATVVGTYVSRWVVRNLPALLRTVVYAITLHDYLLLVWNQLDALQVTGTYLVLAAVVATSSLFITRARHLAEYLATVAILSIVAVILVDHPRTAEPQFLIGIATFTALSYVAVRAHLQTMRRLRESEAEARAVVRAVPDVLVRLAPDGVVLAVMGDARGELARKAQAFAGRRLHELFHEPPADVITALSSLPEHGEVRTFSAPVMADASAASGEAPLQVEVRFLRGDADSRLALLRDVTRERQLEARLRVNDRLAAIGTLASGIGHEINNPLSYVISNIKFVAQMTRTRIHKTGGAEEELSALEDARRGAERIGSIVRSLKSYASGTETLELSADAGECVRSALTILGSELRHGAVISVELDAMPRLRAEPFRMTQVLVNLISNALQSVPNDKGHKCHIWIRRGSGSGGQVSLEVQDNGCGIRVPDLARVFDPFFTTKSPGQGTGLGLYVCHQIVTALGGTIEVTSTEGVGTTFRIFLPTADLPSQPPVANVPVASRP